MTSEHTALVARMEASYPAAYSEDVAAAIAAIRALSGKVERLKKQRKQEREFNALSPADKAFLMGD